ncbi:hypothetical protein FRACYDRAFT_250069 [Fragilariopsis cylindrus CCMP1102]|uniref:Sulfotransferase domain-containing protein n=1 Tax=Fragilariopsis cylindrus CCMP1102 TaxID=635003 RepID=A0A1E7EQJ4_9STRA|nr:hypothetical protein FRACYDRAFT_250069 [Fragilariopsis cylindrus CCMP1102]|eukprot:OEU08280.1 hypothetical protein FRACYDRAFT_250069 [Fragilariopsis cylindrus CCMP1102]
MNATTKTTAVASSHSRQQKRKDIRKQNQLHQNQNKCTYFIYGQNGEQKSNWIYNAQFLHVGKAGGGTIRERIEKLNFNIEYKHSPIGRNNTQTTETRTASTSTSTTASTSTSAANEKMTYLIGIRDPIDRYISNFYWQGLTLCLEDNSPDNDTDINTDINTYTDTNNSTNTTIMSYNYNDTRKKSEPLHAVTRKPNKYCRLQTKNIPTSTDISNMIHIKYNSNANELAESLCSTESKEQEDAIQDMNMLSHAKHTLWDWLQVTGILQLHTQNNETTSTSSRTSPIYTKNKNVNVAGMVVEHGYDFLQQIDHSIEYAFTNSLLQQQTNSDSSSHQQRQRQHQHQLVAGDHYITTNTAATTAHDIMETKLLNLNNDGDDSTNSNTAANQNQNQRKKVKQHSSFSSSSSSENKQSSIGIQLLDYSNLPWIQKMQHHQRHGLSKKGACCLANHFYWKDYHILFKPTSTSSTSSKSNDIITSTFLGDIVCNYGTSNDKNNNARKSQICIDALNSISQRYRNLQCNNDNEEENEQEEQYDDRDNDNDNNNEKNDAADVDVDIKIKNKDKDHQRQHQHQRQHEVVNNTAASTSTSSPSPLSSLMATSTLTSTETMMMKTTLQMYPCFLMIFFLWLYMVKHYIHNTTSINNRNKPQQKR